MSELYLLPVGNADGEVLRMLGQALPERIEAVVRGLPAMAMPEDAYDARRNQFEATRVLRGVLDAAPDDDGHILALVEEDLFIPMLTFVFGQAQLRGRTAVMSTTRLRQEYYGLPPDRTLFLTRALKEALHELGHTFGLIHCPDSACVMMLSNAVQQIDGKGDDFCDGCRALLDDVRRSA